MILSQSEAAGDWTRIRAPAHVAQVLAALDANVENYLDRWLAERADATAAGALAGKFEVKMDARTLKGRTLRKLLDDALVPYDRDAKKYRDFFEEDSLDEFRDGGANAFKTALRKEVPVIQRTWNSPNEELAQWKIKFQNNASKELLATFENLMEFASEWERTKGAAHLDGCASAEEVGLDAINDDPTMYVIGVVGVGIKSTVLFHQWPASFPKRDRQAMFGLFFLTGKAHFGLSTGSEFQMIVDRDLANDGAPLLKNHRTEHNFWYPYGLFSLYAVRVWKHLKAYAARLGVPLDESHRFVWLDAFFQGIAKDLHAADIRTLLGNDERNPGWP